MKENIVKIQSKILGIKAQTMQKQLQQRPSISQNSNAKFKTQPKLKQPTLSPSKQPNRPPLFLSLKIWIKKKAIPKQKRHNIKYSIHAKTTEMEYQQGE